MIFRDRWSLKRYAERLGNRWLKGAGRNIFNCRSNNLDKAKRAIMTDLLMDILEIFSGRSKC
ncbi:hypothetical protein BGP75_00170 [Motiliproteus sp. MSK22-1]|nr:hypothetical protein BGP75_00170 [Motiliproteus sp. MSK22-1]